MKKNEGSPLLQLLRKKNKTTVDLAEALSIRERTVFYWLSGDRVPKFTLEEVHILCNFFECSFDELPVDFSRDASKEATN